MVNQALQDAYRYWRQTYPRVWATIAFKEAIKDVVEGRKRYPHSPGYKYGGNWQPLDSMKPRQSRAYYCDEWPEGWRLVGRADEVERNAGYSRSIDHTGWYTRDDGDNGNTIAGYVLRLPHGRLIPGYRASGWDGVTLYPLDQYDDLMECARAADHYAERVAEDERDYNRAWDAGQEAGDADERAKELRREVIQVCSDLRTARREIGHGSEALTRLCGVAREKVADLLEQLQELRQKRDQLRDDVPARLMGAFNEGFASR